MTIGELGSLGELLGSLGVFATLIYLALQIRQNNRIARASAHLELARERRELMQHSNELYEAEGAFRSGDLDLARDVNNYDVVVMSRSMDARVRNWEVQWHYWRNGLIDENQLESYSMIDLFRLDSMCELWAQLRETYHPDFVDYVDSKIAGRDA
jgi:hypothetical protein